MSNERTARRPDTRDPHRSRERALKVLFQADVRGLRPIEILQRIAGDDASLDLLDDPDDRVGSPVGAGSDAVGSGDRGVGSGDAPPPLDAFSRALVLGVEDHLEEIDAVLDRLATGWTVSRMPVVDRNILRLGAYELLHEETPAAVVIDEALEFAKALSTERSHRFVNGVLEAVRREHAARPDERPGPEGAAERP